MYKIEDTRLRTLIISYGQYLTHICRMISKVHFNTNTLNFQKIVFLFCQKYLIISNKLYMSEHQNCSNNTVLLFFTQIIIYMQL